MGSKIVDFTRLKKTTKRGGGGQKLPILRRHSLWTAPKCGSPKVVLAHCSMTDLL